MLSSFAFDKSSLSERDSWWASGFTKKNLLKLSILEKSRIEFLFEDFAQIFALSFPFLTSIRVRKNEENFSDD